ncbi:ATP-binding protein [Janibacter sp. GS2]|uniref:sensor histidine kinase n=1 Tax=Janibacter sp. GS2 TaxID=3442646 RepID=UPI003EBDEC0B
MKPRLTLASQLLGLQGLIVLAVILLVTPVTVAQADRAFQRTETRRVLATAENIAGTLVVQQGLAGDDGGVAGEAERIRSTSGLDYVVVLDEDREVVYDSDPGIEDSLPPGTQSTVSVEDHGDDESIQAQVPVTAVSTTGGDEVGDIVGYVIIGRNYPTLLEQISAAAPSLLGYVLIGSVIGLGGSLLLSRRIKRQTLGLEPTEIRGLVEHREALLHGLREGVVGVDPDGTCTLINDEATRLLEIPRVRVGESIASLDLSESLVGILTGNSPAHDLALTRGARILVLNQMPVRHQGRLIGWVTTIRDRTELMELTRQVDVWRSTTDTLRAQTHEFSNYLHTISGLIEIGAYSDVATFVNQQARAHDDWVDHVLRLILDPSVAALLVAKGSRAAERGVSLILDQGSSMESLNESLTAPTLTVVGNLVDNALDAVEPPAGEVVVHIARSGSDLEVTVSDNGPGVAEPALSNMFEAGYSTKGSTQPGGRGWGLALVGLTCEQHGGSASYHRDGEGEQARTSFVAILPIEQEVSV